MTNTDPPPADFSLLDRSDILAMMFYPRADRTPTPPGTDNLHVEVAPDVRVHARFYPVSPALPTVLFFHGNGEVVADYDDIAPIYHEFGMNLFVVDYRGYGRSTGSPSFTSMLADAHKLKDAFFTHLEAGGFNRGRYLMGRSLGALPAVELAATAPDGFRGVILESGAAGVRGWSRFMRYADDPGPWEALHAAQRARLAAVTLPFLSIHGAEDELIPVETAVEVRETVGSTDGDLVIIAGAGHNDLLYVGLQQYFQALARFVSRLEGRS
ncbi:MAG: alpha/beta hydrolase [Dehalococcoidia bacterium]